MRSNRICATTLLMVSLSTVPASAQLASHTYDIVRYELEIKPDFSTGDLRVDAQIRIRNPRFEPVFRFGLSGQFESVQAMMNGSVTDVRRSGGVVEVAAPAGVDARLQFTLHGRSMRSEDEGRPFIDNESLMASLRAAIGDDAFRRGIRLLFERYRYRTFTLDQFISVFEECAKRSRRASVRAVLMQTGR